jgi:hypothetical protein
MEALGVMPHAFNVADTNMAGSILRVGSNDRERLISIVPCFYSTLQPRWYGVDL